ncbi:SIR2 family protein [Dethiobacter alkaliphilus]|uniref:Uncharacterized protein n=1 Tax=Dethiobacter alkaliphilus AHT 1 TaxID=555088 RepID=C0GI92_DETAL|nr:SIR2 family protein [Dethiobacter alkaliphilus]EEG76940.1 hypothetical protein DealDRAFT_2201 [Dethiobacter alkaliphilus AHT 1]
MDLYLLGAGFSSDAGVPTMKNFIAAVEQTKETLADKTVWEVLDRAVGYAAETGTQNIEDLLAAAINKPVFFDLIWAFGMTINQCSRKFLDICRTGGDVGWYQDFARLLANTDARVLTFNYDLILEDVLWWRTGLGEDYSLSFTESYCRPCHTAKAGAVPIYKLHGSISWLRCLSCSYSANRYRHILADAYHQQPCPLCQKPLIPLIIPPTFHKASVLARPLTPLWQQADRLLARATRIIIGGLSFAQRDADIRARFISGIKNNLSLEEVVIINRDEKRCAAIGELLPPAVPWRAVSGFPQFCRETQNRDGPFFA